MNQTSGLLAGGSLVHTIICSARRGVMLCPPRRYQCYFFEKPETLLNRRFAAEPPLAGRAVLPDML